MGTVKEIEARRETILEELRKLRSLERGTINAHYVPVKRRTGKTVKKGPYYVISRRESGKTVGYHLSEKGLARARQDVEAHHRFRELCREYEELTERLGAMERGLGEGTVKKKRLRRRSSSRRR